MGGSEEVAAENFKPHENLSVIQTVSHQRKRGLGRIFPFTSERHNTKELEIRLEAVGEKCEASKERKKHTPKNRSVRHTTGKLLLWCDEDLKISHVCNKQL
jgi:hypothetical protein